MMVAVSPLGCDAHKVKLWHFRAFLLLLALSAPLLITSAEAKDNFYKVKLEIEKKIQSIRNKTSKDIKESLEKEMSELQEEKELYRDRIFLDS